MAALTLSSTYSSFLTHHPYDLYWIAYHDSRSWTAISKHLMQFLCSQHYSSVSRTINVSTYLIGQVKWSVCRGFACQVEYSCKDQEQMLAMKMSGNKINASTCHTLGNVDCIKLSSMGEWYVDHDNTMQDLHSRYFRELLIIFSITKLLLSILRLPWNSTWYWPFSSRLNTNMRCVRARCRRDCIF